MKSKIFALGLLSLTMVVSCKKEKEEVVNEVENVEVENYVVKNDSVSVEIDNQKELAIVTLNEEKFELKSEKSASGFIYSNDDFELLGKGNDVTLKKGDKIILEHKDDIVNLEAKNEKGDVLTLVFNNSEGSLKAYLNGGEEIQLKEEKTASGISYSNDEYELTGKGESYLLKKGEEVVFEN